MLLPYTHVFDATSVLAKRHKIRVHGDITQQSPNIFKVRSMKGSLVRTHKFAGGKARLCDTALFRVTNGRHATLARQMPSGRTDEGLALGTAPYSLATRASSK